MLEKFLKYHQTLLSDEFVKGVLKRIEKAYQTRIMVLGIASLLGLGIAMVALNSFMKISWYQTLTSYLFDTQFLLYSAVALLLGFTICAHWLFDDGEFQ